MFVTSTSGEPLVFFAAESAESGKAARPKTQRLRERRRRVRRVRSDKWTPRTVVRAQSLAGASSGLRGSSSSAHSAHSARNRAAEVEACASSNDDAMARSERGGLSESALLSELRKDARSTEGGAFPEGDSPSVSVEFTAPAIATGAPPCRLEASSPEGRGARARAMRGAECVSCRVLRSRSSEVPVKNFGRRPIARV